MIEKLTWEEIKKKYPNEWVSLSNCERDNTGLLIKAEVFTHSKERKEVFAISAKANMITNLIDYTGVPANFLGFSRLDFIDVQAGK